MQSVSWKAHVSGKDSSKRAAKGGFTSYGNYGWVRWCHDDDGTFQSTSHPKEKPPRKRRATRGRKNLHIILSGALVLMAFGYGIPACFLSYLQLTIILIMPPKTITNS